jgi:hypothetical protein
VRLRTIIDAFYMFLVRKRTLRNWFLSKKVSTTLEVGEGCRVFASNHRKVSLNPASPRDD